ncbi:MAG: hypothetical protein KDA41_13940 [Planctomycetales bacterium]|nr:hypothetical protein [Planctomycetales bacterium]
MAKNSLATRLAKDLKRNPKKTAVLALLALVAVWFWIPLVTPYFASESTTDNVAPTSTVAAQPAAAAPKSAKPAPDLDWKKVAQQMEQRTLLQRQAIESLNAGAFSAFAQAEAVETAVEEEAFDAEATAAPAATPVDLSPDALGLQLSSTLIGGRVSLAVISGRVCRVGNVVVVPVDDKEYEFQVAAISPDEVAMQSGVHLHVLSNKRAESAVELMRASAAPDATASGNAERIVVNPRSHRQESASGFAEGIAE